MKNKVLMFGAIAMVMLSVEAMAQQDNQQAGGQGGQASQEQRQQRFEAVKQKITERIQERLSCVQNAQDPEALRACMPKRNGRGQRGPGGNGPGGNQGGKPGGSGGDSDDDGDQAE